MRFPPCRLVLLKCSLLCPSLLSFLGTQMLPLRRASDLLEAEDP